MIPSVGVFLHKDTCCPRVDFLNSNWPVLMFWVFFLNKIMLTEMRVVKYFTANWTLCDMFSKYCPVLKKA